MIVKVVIENITKEGTAPVTLAGPAGKPAVSVHVRDEDKTIMRWGFQRAQGNPPNQPLQIAPGQAVTYVFLLSPKKSSKVESGTYRIFGSVAGIRGAVHPVTVTVEDHPESLSESQEASRQKLESLYRLFAGKK